MFEVGFWELALCFVIALVVLGPERLPGVARALGRWTGQARAYMRNLTAELERETQVGELKKQLLDASHAVQREVESVKETAHETVDETMKQLTDDRPASGTETPPLSPGRTQPP